MHVERVFDVLAVLERLPHEQVGQEDALKKAVIDLVLSSNRTGNWIYRASRVLVDWVLLNWISSVPLSARLCLG